MPVLKSSPKEPVKKKVIESIAADVFTVCKEHAEVEVSNCLCTKRREALLQQQKLTKTKSPTRKYTKRASTDVNVAAKQQVKPVAKITKNKSPKETKSPRLKVTQKQQKKPGVLKAEEEGKAGPNAQITPD